MIFRKPAVLLVLIAITALAIGLLVYLLDRQPDRVYFLSHGLSLVHGRHPLFGVMGGYLPAFVHVYAFILLTVAIAGSSNTRLLRICTLWFVIAALFESGQHPLLAPRIAAALPAWFARVPVLDNTAAFFLKGTFDLLDLLSIALGTVAGYLTAVLIRNRVGAGPSDKPRHSVFRYLALGGLTLFGMLAIIGSGGGGVSSGATPASTVDFSQLYISNNSGSTLLSYNNANTVSGSTAVNRVVAGGSTTLNQPRGIAVDMPHNQIYVANFATSSILVFNNARTVSGGNAPDRAITPAALNGPSSLFIDSVNDRLYVASTNNNSILVYDNAHTLNGNPLPTRTLAGIVNTTLNAPLAVFVDVPRNRLYVLNGDNKILTFTNASAITGDVAPSNTVVGANTTLSNPVGLYVDVQTDRMYVANTGVNTVLVFDSASTATGNIPPTRMVSGGVTQLNQPTGVFVDTGTDRLYVANGVGNSILVFNNASTVNNTIAPNRTLSLSAATGPWGVYVDVTPIVIGSTANLDGYARSDGTASATGSPATGDKDASFPGVGWRQLYSFDISSISTSATITSATLHLYQCDVVGAPYASLGNVIMDHVNYGGVFDPFGSAYNGATVAPNIGTLSTTTGLGYHSLNVTTLVQDDLSMSRVRSQYRLKFSIQDTNSDFTDDFVQFTDAEDSPCVGAATNQPPQLAISLKP